ncbi:MAG: glycosyltransferase family 2 protein [Kiritimatiellae bacterium]|nr:glycosyltransferase family 2 protein [Kiritimatiellia bacterium]
MANTAKKNKKVSVIIPTYNRSAVLRECVDSVLRSDYSPIGVVIVDNASTDDTESACALRYGADTDGRHVQYIRLPENRMAAGGRNAGISHAKGDYLLFLDNDNIIEPEMIGHLVRVFETHPDIGLVGALSIQADRGCIWTLGADYNFLTSMPINLHEGERPETVHMQVLYPTRYSPNAVMVTRTAMERAKVFDPFYKAMYEEADFGFRITGAGFKGVICSSARTLHLGAVGSGQVSALRRLGIETPERAYLFARNRSVFMRRFAPWHGQFVFFLLFIHMFTLYYCWTAIRHARTDIAYAYFRGAFRGLLIAFFHMPPLPQDSVST